MPKKDNSKLLLAAAILGGIGIFAVMRSSSVASRVKDKLMANMGQLLASPSTADAKIRAALGSRETATFIPAKSDTVGNSWTCWVFNDGSLLTFSYEGVNSGFGLAIGNKGNTIAADWVFSDSGAGKYTTNIVKASIGLFA